MPRNRGLTLTATAVVLALSFGTESRAEYSYEVMLNPAEQLIRISDQTTIRFTPQTGRDFTVDPTNVNNLPLATIVFEKTSIGTENINVNYAINLKITNPQTGGETKSFAVTGRLFGSASLSATGSKRLDLSNEYLTLTPASGEQNIGGTTFRFQLPIDRSFKFSGPGFGPGLTGSFTAQIAAVPIPEPGSIALMGLGGLGVAWVGWRRRRAAA